MIAPNNSLDLQFARDALAALRTAYLEYQKGGNSVVKQYRIKDRLMEYRDSADLLKQINYWEREVRRLEAAEGLRPGGQIRVRF